MPTKIETHLTPEQFHEFCKRCAQTKGGTLLRSIQAIAEEFGVTISLMSATAVRDGPLADYLEELRATATMAESVAALAKNGVGLSEGAASAFAAKVFDAARTVSAEDIGSEKGNNVSLAIARLQSGDRNAKKLAADLKLRDEQIAVLVAEREERARKKAELTQTIATAKRGGLTKETLAKIEEAAGLL